jgi:sortase A
MHIHRHIKIFALIVFITASSLAGVAIGRTIAANLTSSPITKEVASVPAAAPEEFEIEEEPYIPAHPVSITIPAINVHAPVEHVGLDDEQKMDVPQHDDNVGWYKYGAIPGQTGNAVLAGHLDSTTGPSVFYHLHTLTAGDEIIVTDTDNIQHRFSVIETASYPLADFPMDAVFGQHDGIRLNLITCEGTFNRSSQLYSHRTVVYAEFVETDT